MSAEVTILVATVVVAVVAIGAAVVAVRAARKTPSIPPERLTAPPPKQVAQLAPLPPTTPTALEPRVVEGQLIVPPSNEQVVNTALGRPGVRLSILAHGLAYALRPESRDRITGMMRREYRRRRRERLQAGRRAVRAARPTPPSEEWLGS